MIYVYGVLGALAFYFGMRLLYRSLEFVFTGRVFKVSRLQWYLTSLAIFIAVSAQLLLPPSRDIYLEPVLTENVSISKGDAAKKVVLVSELMPGIEGVGPNLKKQEVHPSINNLEVWSLSRKDKLNYDIPSYGLWYLFNRLPEQVKYQGRVADYAIATTRMNCHIVIPREESVSARRVCELVTPVNMAVDVLNVKCLAQLPGKLAKETCKPVVQVRFPTLSIRIDKGEMIIDVFRSWTGGKIDTQMQYEVFADKSDGEGIWISAPARIPLADYKGKPFTIRLLLKDRQLILSRQFTTRGHFSGKVPRFLKIQGAQASIKGGIEYVDGFLRLGSGFSGKAVTYEISKDKILYRALGKTVQDQLFSAGGYEKCPKLYSSANIHGLVSYLKLNMNHYRNIHETLVSDATDRHQGLKALQKIEGKATCTERQVSLEVMAHQVKSILPEDVREMYFQNIGLEVSQTEEKDESVLLSP